MSEEELEKENANLKVLRKYELNVAKVEIEKLEKENAELKAIIEKMRNFQNCDYQLHIIDCPIFKSGGHISCKKCPHWILQEVSE